jgi:peptidoglycan hydrolase-like protein with peptidoglycan-binding domain
LFPHNLELWEAGDEVLLLQQFLNAHGFEVATSGPGSPGDETDFFGMKTYNALVKFQDANGLPATGYFGPLTRAAIAGMSTTTTSEATTASQ